MPRVKHLEATKGPNAGPQFNDAVPVLTTITDIVVPGLGVTIGAVLLLIKELCKRLLKRKHERILQVSKRLGDLYNHATKMEKKGKFALPEWLRSFCDIVARFQAFMAACEEKNVLMRLVGGGKENKQVREFEEEVYSLYRSMDFQRCSGGGSCCIQ